LVEPIKGLRTVTAAPQQNTAKGREMLKRAESVWKWWPLAWATVLLLFALSSPAQAYFGTAHTHTGEVLQIVYEQFGVGSTADHGKVDYTQNNTTVKNPIHNSHQCGDSGYPGWVLLDKWHNMENETDHVGESFLCDWYHPQIAARYTMKGHFHAFGEALGGGWDVNCQIKDGSLPPSWYFTCSGSRS
jgi:hypothetical protein